MPRHSTTPRPIAAVPQRLRGGFTLLELLVVVTIITVLAGGVILAMSGVEETSREQVALTEILNVKQALLRFQQDTGRLPKQGLFDTDASSAWLHSPANLGQLFIEPVDGFGQPLAPWNQDTRRGWRGPYLSRFGEGEIIIGDGLLTNGNGSPTAGNLLTSIPAAVDPWGNPYLVFDLDDRGLARVMSMGPNGVYESNSVTAGGDDLVVELFR